MNLMITIVVALISIALSGFILYQVILAAVTRALRLSRYDRLIVCPNCQIEVAEGKECPKCGKRYSRYFEMPPRR